MNINQLKINNDSDAIRQAARQLHIISRNMAENVDDEDVRAKKEAKIRSKLEAGVPLTRKEMEFLRKYNPRLYAIALRVEIKRKALEERLSHAKSKSEVQDIQLEAMATIRKDDPAKKYMVAAVEYAMKEFKETKFYKTLPETKEEAKKCRAKDADFEVEAEEEKEAGQYELVYECGTGTGVLAYQMAYVK